MQIRVPGAKPDSMASPDRIIAFHLYKRMLIIKIKQGKEKSLLDGHCWIYASAVERVDGRLEERLKSGATAVVQSSSGKFLARAAYSPQSQIRARVWSFDQGEPIDHALIKRRVRAAVVKRAGTTRSKRLTPAQPLRVIVGEEDGLSGLSVDWFTEAPGYLVCQFLSAGVDAWKVAIVQSLMAETGCPNVYERSDALMRKAEALPDISGPLAGDEPPEEMLFTEKTVRYVLDLKSGERRKFV